MFPSSSVYCTAFIVAVSHISGLLFELENAIDRCIMKEIRGWVMPRNDFCMVSSRGPEIALPKWSAKIDYHIFDSALPDLLTRHRPKPTCWVELTCLARNRIIPQWVWRLGWPNLCVEPGGRTRNPASGGMHYLHGIKAVSREWNASRCT